MMRPTDSLLSLARAPHSLARTGLSIGLAATLALAPIPALAAPPDDGGDAAAEPAATVGGNVAILKFTGGGDVPDAWRGKVKEGLEYNGYTANYIKVSIDDAASKNKCRNVDDACLAKVGAYLNKNSRTAYDFYVYADLPAGGQGSIVIYDIAKGTRVTEMAVAIADGDYILPEIIGPNVARRLAQYQQPPAPATDEEKAYIASLDEPDKTPEEIAAEKKRLEEAEAEALANYNANVQAGEQTVDLRDDFKEFCREGKREDKEVQNPDGTVSKERDLRPKCSRGPVFGYWQPRAWVALTLTIGSGAGMGVMYGMASAARSDWSTARDNLQSSGLSATDPADNDCDSGECYQNLAGEVSDATAKIRTRAIVGDVLLGSTVLLAGVLAIIIYQDRQAAKGYIGREKELRALSNFRLAPVFSTTMQGAAVGFDFGL